MSEEPGELGDTNPAEQELLPISTFPGQWSTVGYWGIGRDLREC